MSMPDRGGGTQTRSCTPATRRAVLAGAAGGIAASWIGWARAGTYADPPIFRTVRAQYAVLDPMRPLRPAILSDLNGRPRQIGPVTGKVQLVHVWASWCALCREDLIELQRFESLADPDVVVTTISVDTVDARRISAFLDGLGLGRLSVLLDPRGLVAGRDAGTPLPLYGLPITYVVTPSGLVAGYIKGRADWGTPEGRRLLTYYGS